MTNVAPWVDTLPVTTGLELRLERVAHRVKLQDLAARMGRSRATVHRYEGQAVVDPTAAAEYRKALANIVEDATKAAA